MKKLRFEETPDVEAETHGEPGCESESRHERENLPEDVEAGKTYRRARLHRHVSIRLREGDG